MCIKPFTQGVHEYGCGQCIPCRFLKRRIWTGRLLLEACKHDEITNATLTYNDAHLPENGALSKRHIQLFLKRFRKSIEPKKIRYYMAGEYGGRTGRPHYHIIIFGSNDYIHIDNAWTYGHVHYSLVTIERLAYCCKHIAKGNVDRYKTELEGLPPEFHLMSRGRKKGEALGTGTLDGLAQWITSEQGSIYLLENGDVPGVIRVGKELYPIGLYLKKYLKNLIGIQENQTTKSKDLKTLKRMYELMEKGQDYFEEKRRTDYERALQKYKMQKLRRIM